MTQQGKRHAKWRTWAGTSGTYNGDMIAAANVLTAGAPVVTSATQALHTIAGGLAGAPYTPKDEINDVLTRAATALGVTGGWPGVGDEIPDVPPTWPPV